MCVCVCVCVLRSPLISPTLPSLVTLLLNKLARGIPPRLSRPPTLCDNDESILTLFINRQFQLNKNTDTKNISLYNIISSQDKLTCTEQHSTIEIDDEVQYI